MNWVLVATISLAAWLFARWWLARCSDGDFERWIHSLVQVKVDGGALDFYHVGSPFLMRVRRMGGSCGACEVWVDLPRTGWSESRRDVIDDLLRDDEIGAFEPGDSPGVLLRVRTSCSDLDSPASIASAARAARAIARAFGVGRDAKYRMKMTGANSSRVWSAQARSWKNSRNPFARWLGAAIERGTRQEHRE